MRHHNNKRLYRTVRPFMPLYGAKTVPHNRGDGIMPVGAESMTDDPNFPVNPDNPGGERTAMTEDIIGGTTYKLISAEDNEELSRKLEQISIYSLEAAKINQKSGINSYTNPEMAFRGHTYEKLAADLRSRKFKNEFGRGKYLLLAEDHYESPIKTESLFFAMHPELKEKATVKELSAISKSILEKRDPRDVSVPEVG